MGTRAQNVLQSQSLDLNPNENPWSYLKKEVHVHKPIKVTIHVNTHSFSEVEGEGLF